MPISRPLNPAYTSEIDTADEPLWSQLLSEFDDANVYQTWQYAEVLSGRRNMSEMILRKNGDIVAMAQVRIAKLPLVNVGVAYVGWGPLWRRRFPPPDPETFRQAIRALRNEFSCRRGLVLRLQPVLYTDDPKYFVAILEDEGFSATAVESPRRTILMDLSPSLDVLRAGMNPHWRRELRLAERHYLEIVEGSDDDLFGAFITMYREMVARKKFLEGNDINQFRLMQARLPKNMKFKLMLCKSAAGLCSGLVCSVIGNTALYLFGATSNAGLKSNGSYLLQWNLIQGLKEKGLTSYDLNGINPDRNPGTYKFKRDLAGVHGKEAHFMGRFETRASVLSHWCVLLGERARTFGKALKQRARTA
jgi:lipid II:glycine glycyltransferase (peptidoglycan interpeptide bridge formation enzyme)